MEHADDERPLAADPSSPGNPAIAPVTALPDRDPRDDTAWLREVLDGVADGITVQDTAGRLVYANPAAARVLGCASVEELLRTPSATIMARFEMFDRDGNPIAVADLPGRRALQGETEPEVLIYYRYRATGERRWAAVQARPVHDERGAVRRVVNTFRDVTERHREGEALRFLDEAGAVLAGSLDYEATLRQVARIAVPRLADWSAVDVLESDGSLRRLAVVAADAHSDGLVVEVRRRSPTSLASPSPTAAVVRDGRAALFPEVTEGLLAELLPDPAARALIRDIGLVSSMIVPLRARGQTFGAVTFATTVRSGRRYGAFDLALAERLAVRAAMAIDNARLYAAARDHAARAAALADALRLIAEARFDEEAVQVGIVRTATEVVGDGSVLRLISGDGQWLSAVATDHRDSAVRPALQVRVAATPMRVNQGLTGLVASTGRPVRIPSDDGAGLEAAVEPDVQAHYEAFGLERVMVVPLRAGGRVIGVLALGRGREHPPYSADDQAFLQDLADIAALAIENVRLYDASGQARLRAEALAAASQAFIAARLDLPAVLETVTRRVADLLGDGVLVRLLAEDNGSVRAVAGHHPDPERRALARRLIEAPPGGVAADDPFRPDQPLLFPEVDPAWLRRRVPPEDWPQLDRLPVRSLLAVPLLAHGRVIGTVIIWRDRTPQPYGIDDQTFLQDLAGRAALAIDNARLYEDARLALRARETFLSIASHELKTPLTSVAGYTQLVRRHIARLTPPAPRLGDLVDKLQHSVGRLDLLVQDLVDVSQLESGRLVLRVERSDLRQLAERVVERFVDEEAAQPRRRHHFTLEAPEPVVGEWDPARLEQVLANLVSNAVKYAPGGGEVRVTVRRDGDTAEVAVQDEGIGISREDQARLFQPFARGSGADAFSGTGLGLYVAREIVEQHGGAVGVTSEPGRGSRFTVRLPIAPAPEPEAAS